MNNADFWASIRTIIAEGFTPEGLLKLDGYAEQFISGKLVMAWGQENDIKMDDGRGMRADD